ncbi:PEP-CTERM sorting domain-containing protein [Adhaeretor mobilis]|uniref:PEP-CTERM motif protein n=1 Tax=Adhaeretor mobilis TaxID=1930276 RepID=A0A517MY05_9BACT|nr:PEP-CTERM sorting domain-containing protein [Adhaeretor mobilis]QDS99760.1 PEP-CTERM motif protein [Adhaeretor mobilis]
MLKRFLSVSVVLVGCLFANASAAPIFVSFSTPGTSASATTTEKFNVFANSSNGAVFPLDVVLPLNDENGDSTGIAITKPDGVVYGGGNGTPTVGGAAAAVGITNFAGQTFHWLQGSNNPRTYTFTGLDPASTYDFSIFGSRNGTGPRDTEYTLDNGTSSYTGTQDVMGNVGDLQLFSGIAPSSTNTIDLTFEFVNGSVDYGYINALRIDVNPVPEPTSLILFGLGSVCLLVGRKRRN